MVELCVSNLNVIMVAMLVKIFLCKKKEIEIVLLNLKYFQKISGLGIARDLLEPIKKKHPNVTYADLYILAGVVAVEEMGGNF